MLFCRQHRFFTLFNQRVVAQLGQRECCLRTFAARHGGGAAARAGACFKPRRKRIANPRGQQACRRARYHFGIDDNHVRVVRQHQVAIELTAVSVNDGKGAARRIGGGDSWGYSHGYVHKMGQRFGGIQRFTAADTQHRQTVGAVGQFFQSVDFIL